MAPARSIQCMRRPPRRALSGLASLGRTISVISEIESRTGRAPLASFVLSSVIIICRSLFVYGRSLIINHCWLRCLWSGTKGGLARTMGLHEARGQAQDACVGMRVKPGFGCQIEGQLAVCNGGVTQFANKADGELSSAGAVHGKTDGIPIAVRGKMRAVRSVTKIAKLSGVSFGCCDVLLRGAAVPGPSRAQREARGMKPGAVVHDFERHKIWTGQFRLRRTAIVTRVVI